MGDTRRQRPRQWPAHHRLAPATPPRFGRVSALDPPPPARGRADHPDAAEAAQILLHPIRRRTTQANVGGPTSPTGGWPTPRMWRSSTGSTTTPATPSRSPHTAVSPAPSSWRPSAKPLTHMAFRPQHSPITEWFSPPDYLGAKEDATASKANYAASGSPRSTPPQPPTTCGKVERFHQTLKKWLTNQPPASAIPELQNQLDTFVEAYNHHRPHRSMPHQATPATARPKAGPATRLDTHDRVRTDCIDQAGVITLRVAGRLHHIGIGRTYTGTRVLILVQDLHIRIINAATGALLRELPSTRQGTTNPPEHPKARNGRSSEPNAGSELFRCLETSH